MPRGAPLSAVLAIAAAIGAPATAQQTETVLLRAGEHAGFSRVVLDLADPRGWTASRDGRALTLRFEGRDIRFDAAQIQTGRRVTRVLHAEGALQDGAAILTLALACDCATNVFALGGDRLVIDVRDRAQTETASAQDSPTTDDFGTPPAPGAAPAPLSRPARASNNTRELVAAADPTARMIVAPPAPAPAAAPRAAATPALPPASAPPAAAAPAPAAVDVDAARRHLLEQLTRAAEQGLLEFRPTPPAAVAEDAAPEDEQARAPEAAPETAPAAAQAEREAPIEAHASAQSGASSNAAPQTETPALAAPVAPPPPAPETSALTEPKLLALDPQVSARSVFDRDAALARRTAANATGFCVADRNLDIASWASGAPMADQIPALRAKLLGEFDRVDGEAALALARLYIHFGFGVEAESALRVLENSGASDAVKETATLLLDLARIVDGRPATEGGPVARSTGCAGRVNVWRLVAGLPATPLDPAAMETLIATAPLHLRRMLAPRLVEALLDLDEVRLAGRIHALLARAEGDHGDAFHLAAARLAGAEGRVAAAEGGYRALIADNSILTDRALLRLAESLLARGAEAPAQLIGDLEAMAFLLRGTPLGRRLRVAEVRLRAGGGGLGPTMSRIELDMGADPAAADDLRRAAQDIWRAAAPSEDDPAEYVRSAILYLRLVGAAPEADAARLAAARELTGLGLPDLALDALTPPLARGVAAARLAAAAAHLARNDPAAALAAIEGEDGEAAEILRARAHAAAGAYPVAFAILAEAESEAARNVRAAAAWRGGDWSAAAALAEDPDVKAMAAFMALNGRPTLAAPAPDAGAETAAEPTADPRAAFAVGAGAETAPSLRAAREALDRADGARRFIEEVLKDG